MGRWAFGLSLGCLVIWILQRIAAREDLSTRRHLEQTIRKYDAKFKRAKVLPMPKSVLSIDRRVRQAS